MLPKEWVDAVNDTVSGIRAVDYVNQISVFHRIQASPGILDAMKFLKNEIGRVSDSEVRISQYDAKGEGKIETWENLYGWKPKSGTLKLVEPEERTLADFQAEPISLAAFSRSADVETEVVYIGRGLEDSDFEGKEIEGKVVLTEGRASLVHKTACLDRGAAGLITYVPPAGIDEIASLRRYEGLWPRPGEGPKTKFGFALTQADGLKLKNWLAEGKTVKVKAKVDAKLGSGKNPVLTALIPGEDKSKEIWLIAHICHPHPGANDNASGSAALLEALRTISRLLKDEVIEKPVYSIRFIWVPEWYGTIHFIDSEPELLARCQAMINMDMVGADPCKSGSKLHLFRTPHSLPSTLNNLVRYWLQRESTRKRDRTEGGTMTPLPWNYHAYGAGSDHFMLTDGTVRIPAVMLNQSPDKFYHTSTDTSDKICPIQMSFATNVLVLSALTLACPNRAIKEALLTLVHQETCEMMNKVLVDGVDSLARCIDSPEDIYPKVMRWLLYAKELGKETLHKAGEEWPLIVVQNTLRDALLGGLEMEYTSRMVVARKAYEGACAEVGLEAKEDHLPEVGKIGFGKEVKRTFKYALSPSYLLNAVEDGPAKFTKLREEIPDINERIDELLNLAVGWMSLAKAWDRICFQFGPMEPKVLLGIVDDLEKAGFIKTRDV